MGSRLRMTSIRLSLSARLPTVSWIFARRAFRSSAPARIALSTAGQYFSCSGRSCNAAFTRSTLMSVSVFRSVPFNRSGVAEACEVCDDCALAIEDPVRKSAVVPSTTIFNIGDLLKSVSPRHPKAHALLRRFDLNQRDQRCRYFEHSDNKSHRCEYTASLGED